MSLPLPRESAITLASRSASSFNLEASFRAASAVTNVAV